MVKTASIPLKSLVVSNDQTASIPLKSLFVSNDQSRQIPKYRIQVIILLTTTYRPEMRTKSTIEPPCPHGQGK